MAGGDRAPAVAVGVNIEQIGAAVGDHALGAPDRAFELARLLHHLGLDAERLRRLGVIDVGAAEIAGHVAAGLELLAAVVPDPIALVVVAMIVEHDIHDRGLVAGLGPERLGAGKAEAAVADTETMGRSGRASLAPNAAASPQPSTF